MHEIVLTVVWALAGTPVNKDHPDVFQLRLIHDDEDIPTEFIFGHRARPLAKDVSSPDDERAPPYAFLVDLEHSENLDRKKSPSKTDRTVCNLVLFGLAF